MRAELSYSQPKYNHIRQLIQSGRFSQIEIDDSKTPNKGILYMIVGYASPFTSEVYNLCNRVYPDWLDILHGLPFNYSTIEYLVKNDLLCINGNSFHAILSIMLERDEWKDFMDLLFSNGTNSNIQAPSGTSLLKNFVWKSAKCIDLDDHYRSRFLTILSYLLEKDADPLLEDKKGVSTLEMFLTFKQDNRYVSLRSWYEDTLTLLHSYV